MKYEDKFHKVEDILKKWQNKRLTLPGKTTIKTLATSLSLSLQTQLL